jgi:hypothetical protein
MGLPSRGVIAEAFVAVTGSDWREKGKADAEAQCVRGKRKSPRDV